MEDKSELQQAWAELQEVPAYVERFDPRQSIHLIVVQYCDDCQCWHNADDGCPQMVEV